MNGGFDQMQQNGANMGVFDNQNAQQQESQSQM